MRAREFKAKFDLQKMRRENARLQKAAGEADLVVSAEEEEFNKLKKEVPKLEMLLKKAKDDAKLRDAGMKTGFRDSAFWAEWGSDMAIVVWVEFCTV